MPVSFKAAWDHFHPQCLPVGHVMREAEHENMTRFALLPGSRVEALNNDELRQLLVRFNTMGDAVLGQGADCWLFVPQTVNQNDLHAARLKRLKKRYGMTPGWEVFVPKDAFTYSLYSAPVKWQNGAFNRLFLHMYQRRMWDIAWMNRDTGALLRPYDAGVDVTQPTPNALMDLVSRYYGWLPESGNGYLRFNQAQMKTSKFQVSKPCAEAINRAIALSPSKVHGL